MGRQAFIEYAEGTDLDTTFDVTVAAAQYEYGHGGYTGTIAEKDGYGCEALTDDLMRYEEAVALAKKLLDEDDKRCRDSDMPACAIPVRGGERTYTEVPVPVIPGGYPDERAAAAAAMAARLTAGETITRLASAAFYGGRRGGRVIATSRCRVSVRTTGSLEQTGWLFFGYAMY